MATQKRRIAINAGDGYVPGINAVVTGTVLAADALGWEVVGIRDGFEGLLFPGSYPKGGVVPLTPEEVRHHAGAPGGTLGTAARSDPFRVRRVNADNGVEEVDRSDELLAALRDQRIDGVVSIAGPRAMSVLFRLARKGLDVVAVPKSVENDLAATELSFGFNSALSFAVEVLDRCRQAAESARKVGVVEVLGGHAGWLALQAGTAVCADAVLIPEIPYDLQKVAAQLRGRLSAGARSGLVVVAEGAVPVGGAAGAQGPVDPMRASLSPNATGPSGPHVIDRSGHTAEAVALRLQRLTDHETYPLVLDQLVKGGPPSAVDRQLGLAYGAGAVRALSDGRCGVMVSFGPPHLRFVPLAEAINKVRTVPADSLFVQTARALGISLGD